MAYTYQAVPRTERVPSKSGCVKRLWKDKRR